MDKSLWYANSEETKGFDHTATETTIAYTSPKHINKKKRGWLFIGWDALRYLAKAFSFSIIAILKAFFNSEAAGPFHME